MFTIVLMADFLTTWKGVDTFESLEPPLALNGDVPTYVARSPSKQIVSSIIKISEGLW